MILFALALSYIAKSQELQLPVNIQSPNAGSLGKYGDVPVSYYTGAPNVNIPLYDVTINGLRLGIDVNYDASGIALDNHPGWVGQNWSLEAGGIITRTAEGMPDEYVLPSGRRIAYFAEALAVHDIDQYDLTTSAGLKQLAEFRGSTPDAIDLEPDIFTFNFMGISGKFFMSSSGKWKVISDTNIEVIFDANDSTNFKYPIFSIIPDYPLTGVHYAKVIYGFKLRDDRGNVYTFGYNRDAIEYSMPFWAQTGYSPFQLPNSEWAPWTANAWHLTSVVDKYGNSIYQFQYDRGVFIASFLKNTVNTTSTCYVSSGFLYQSFTAASGNTNNFAYPISGSLISPVYLTTITSLQGHYIEFERSHSKELTYDFTDLGFVAAYGAIEQAKTANNNSFSSLPLQFSQANTIYSALYASDPTKFDYGTVLTQPLSALAWDELNFIKVSKTGQNGSLQTIKNVNLVFNNNSNERLNLLGISISGASTANAYSYSFNYNQFNLLPGYLSERVDHWGYYRGDKATVIPSSGYFSERTTDPEKVTIGLLQSVTYPTGGTTTFVFEPHDYAQILNNSRNGFIQEQGIAGGVRINSITDFDGVQSITRNFKYITDYVNGGSTSSGVLSFKPTYYWPSWTTHTNNSQDFTQTIFSTNTLIPLGNYFGSHIGYSEVTEVRSDGAMTVYNYVNQSIPDEFPIGTVNAGVSPYQKFADLSFTRSKITQRREYDKLSQLKRSTSYNYRNFREVTTDYSLATNVMWGYSCSNNNDNRYYRGEAWQIFWHDYDVVEEKTTTINNGKEFVEEVYYNKQDFPQPTIDLRLTKAVTKIVSGNQYTSSYNYPLDFINNPQLSDPTIGAQFMVNAGRLGEPIETLQTLNSSSIGVTKTNYDLQNGLCLPSTKDISSTDINNLYTQTYYDSFDKNGNLLQYHTLSQVPISIIWSYGNTLPVAEVLGATYDEVTTAFASQGINMSDINYGYTFSDADFRAQFETLRSQLPAIQIKFYTYNIFGISSMVDANGQTTYYEYDDIGRLLDVKDFQMNIIKSYTYKFK